MRWSYDVEVDALYVYLQEAPVASQVEVTEAVADLADDGTVVGVEVLSACGGFNAARMAAELRLPDEDAGALRFLEEHLHEMLRRPTVTRVPPSVATAAHMIQDDSPRTYALA